MYLGADYMTNLSMGTIFKIGRKDLQAKRFTSITIRDVHAQGDISAGAEI